MPTGSRGADRYQGGMLCLPPPTPNAHRPVRRLRSESFKTALSFVHSQLFHGIFESPVAKNAGIYRSVLKIAALPAELVPSDGVTGTAQFALYGSVKSAGLSVMPVAKCPLSRTLL